MPEKTTDKPAAKEAKAPAPAPSGEENLNAFHKAQADDGFEGTYADMFGDGSDADE